MVVCPQGLLTEDPAVAKLHSETNMCKVYNQIGSLREIKSHLQGHDIYNYNSLNEVINFQKNYSAARQEIISDHKLLVEKEKIILSNEIVQLNNAIKIKKSDTEKELLSELETLNLRLNILSSEYTSSIKKIINYFKRVSLKSKISGKKLIFNLEIERSVQSLITRQSGNNARYQYIVSYFEDAVAKSSLPQLQEIDRNKIIIDQVNNSIYGALGEQQVCKELEKLPDDYILINDFTCKFNPPVYRRQENDHIISVQIDHILVSPAGIFLIETKNWSQNSLNNPNLYSPVQQINRTNFALYRLLNGKISASKLYINSHHWGNRNIPIKNIIAFINHKPNEEFQHVKILTLNKLLGYINYFKPVFSSNETQQIASYLLGLTGK